MNIKICCVQTGLDCNNPARISYQSRKQKRYLNRFTKYQLPFHISLQFRILKKMCYLIFFLSTLNKLLKKQKLRELKVVLCGSDSIFFFFVPIIARPLTQTSYRNFSPGVRSLSRVRCLFPEPNQSTSKTRQSDTKKQTSQRQKPDQSMSKTKPDNVNNQTSQRQKPNQPHQMSKNIGSQCRL